MEQSIVHCNVVQCHVVQCASSYTRARRVHFGRVIFMTRGGVCSLHTSWWTAHHAVNCTTHCTIWCLHHKVTLSYLNRVRGTREKGNSVPMCIDYSSLYQTLLPEPNVHFPCWPATEAAHQAKLSQHGLTTFEGSSKSVMNISLCRALNSMNWTNIFWV